MQRIAILMEIQITRPSHLNSIVENYISLSVFVLAKMYRKQVVFYYSALSFDHTVKFCFLRFLWNTIRNIYICYATPTFGTLPSKILHAISKIGVDFPKTILQTSNCIGCLANLLGRLANEVGQLTKLPGRLTNLQEALTIEVPPPTKLPGSLTNFAAHPGNQVGRGTSEVDRGTYPSTPLSNHKNCKVSV